MLEVRVGFIKKIATMMTTKRSKRVLANTIEVFVDEAMRSLLFSSSLLSGLIALASRDVGRGAN